MIRGYLVGIRPHWAPLVEAYVKVYVPTGHDEEGRAQACAKVTLRAVMRCYGLERYLTEEGYGRGEA